MYVGKKVIQLREDKDLTQKELAESIDINRSVLNRIEQGTRPVRDDELKRLSDFFDVPSDYLLGRIPEGKGFFQHLMETHDKNQKTSSNLSPKEEREIESDLEDMMTSMASAAYEADDAEKEDIEALQATLRAAMIQAKKIAKRKYTPKKYRKD